MAQFRTNNEALARTTVLTLLMIISAWTAYGITYLIFHPPMPDTARQDAC